MKAVTKITRWLKSIYLAPFMMIFANFDETGASAGAETQTADADSQGAPEQTGAETQTADADSQGQQADASTASTEAETTGQEAQSETEVQKQPHQTTEAERFEQLRRERDEDRRKLAELEAKINTPPQQDFMGEDVESQVKINIAKAAARISELQIQINSNSDAVTPEVADELIRLQDWVDEAKAALRDNVAKRTAAQQQKEETQKQTESYQKAQVAHQEKLESAIKMIGEQEKIPAELGQKIRDFVSQEFEKDPLFCAEAMEVLERRGYVAHVKFCLDHARAKMGKEAVIAQQKKEEAKNQHPGGATSTATPQTVNLDQLLKKAQDSGSEEDYVAFVTAKEQEKQRKT